MKTKTKKTKVKYRSLFVILIVLIIIFSILLSFFYGAINVSVMEVCADVGCSGKAMCLIEAQTGRILAEKNSYAKLAMASTTKIMTAITAIEHCEDLDEVFEVSDKAIGVEGTSLYLRKGEKHSLRDLLYGLMLVSGNDASVAIGERVGGTVEHFVDLMNFTAYKIGVKNTHFENTHGLDEKGHYTCAYDLAKITAYALNNPVFKEIVSTQNKKIVNADGKVRYLCNKNKLLRTFNGAIGVKTGFTDDAGRCLVSAAERDGMRLVCVVLNCGPMFEESSSLLDWGFNNFKLYNLVENVHFDNIINVSEGEKQNARVGNYETYFYPLKEGELNKLKVDVVLTKNVIAPLQKNSQVGEYKIFFDNNLLFSGKIVTMENIKERSLKQRLFDILDQW